MGHLIDPCSFLGLALDPDIDEPLGEYAATGQVLMILPERFKCFVKGLGQTVDLCLLLVGKIEEIEVIGTPAACRRIDLVDNAVKACHQNGSICVIRIAGAVGIAKLKTL